MADSSDIEEIKRIISEVVQQIGFSLVEQTVFLRKGTLHVRIIVYREGGVGSEGCTQVYKNVYPRLEILHESRDISLEVSSPGVNRVLKGEHEFALFQGHRIKVIWGESTDWQRGTIKEADHNQVILEEKGETMKIPFSEIKKAQLLFEWANGEKK